MTSAYIKKIIKFALAEDIGAGDITTQSLVPVGQKARARLIVKSDAVICGLGIARQAFLCLDSRVVFKAKFKDGQRASQGAVLAEISGSARDLLSAERVAINFLSHLSAIATKTRVFVDAVKPYKAMIMDTRKTTPLLRSFERYAVQSGGGVNQRFNLNDMAMIKDNHEAFCRPRQSLSAMVAMVKSKTKKKVEIEVENFKELKEALQSRAGPAQKRRYRRRSMFSAFY